MKKLIKLILPVLLLTTAVLNTVAQENWCGFDQNRDKKFAENPKLEAQYYDNFARVDQFMASHDVSDRAQVITIIPIVFHVMHNNGFGNIPYSQILEAVDVLNEDYRRLNSDASQTRAQFTPYAADCEIEFRLAQIDPSGNCTNGVVRVNAPTATVDADDNIKHTSTGGDDAWPTDKYLNVWVVNTIGGSGPGIILGYAQFPGFGQWDEYGVVVRHDYIGRYTGTAVSDSRTLTHEIGHCLGLLHTFNNGCGNNCSSLFSGDGVCDTPPAATDTYGCNLGQNSCSNDASGPSPYSTDVEDQIENYMSYDACQNMFSLDQKTRMYSSISTYSQLTNLVSSANLTATGTDGNDILCAADFEADNLVICQGEQVQFTDYSYWGQSSWSWTFNGGYPWVSNDTNPVVNYFNPGTYDITLEVSNGTDTKTTTKTAYITVMPAPGYQAPWQEDFESVTDLNTATDWNIVNDNGPTWVLETGTGYSGTKCAKMNNFGNISGQTDYLESTSFDLSPMSSAVISFRVAYVQRNTSNNDKLWLYVSNDCGKTWAPKWAKSGTTLMTASPVSTAWAPSSSADWDSIAVTIASFNLTENTRFRFQFDCDGGNNLYLDDINISGTYNTVPLLVSPLDGTIGTGTSVTIDWKSVYGVDQYEWNLATNSAFTAGLQSGTTNYISQDATLSDTKTDLSGLSTGQMYYWRVRTVTGGNPGNWSTTWHFKVSQSGVGIGEDASSAGAFNIYPNPAADILHLSFNGKTDARATLVISDALGKVVFTKELKINKGNNVLVVDPKLAKGVYNVILEKPGGWESSIIVIR